MRVKPMNNQNPDTKDVDTSKKVYSAPSLRDLDSVKDTEHKSYDTQEGMSGMIPLGLS
jgi:hypothetical protein